MSAKSKAAIDALNALFAPAPVYAQEEVQAIEIPHTLDAVIESDLGFTSDVPLYRWYKGQDAKGVIHVVRFQRGLSLEQWHESLARQKLVSVQGPYRSATQAQTAPKASQSASH